MRISLNEAVEFIKKGKVVAIPTETVYGLAASIQFEEAIEEIFLLKGRPNTNPLIVHLPYFQALNEYCIIEPHLQKLADAFWPGPLTIVLEATLNKIPSIARAGLSTVAFRVPAHPLTKQLLCETGPLVAPSANLSGRPSSTSVEHVEQDFGNHFPVLDGGICQEGLESTIITYQEGQWKIIRKGALSAEEFVKILGYLPPFVGAKKGDTPLCPGQMFRHYAPKAKLHLQIQDSVPLVLGFIERDYLPKKQISLGSLSQPLGVAQNLYAILRKIDEEGYTEASVDMNFPIGGIWDTIRERLERASLP